MWVAAGTYHEPFQMAPGISVLGGFEEGDTARRDRDSHGGETILDGGGAAGPVVTVPADVDRSSVPDRFTIRNGSYGVYCEPGASPVIANNRIIDNADGGIYCEGIVDSEGPMIRDNEITGNTAPNGGGILCVGCPAAIQGNTITLNVAEGMGTGEETGRGGGICCLPGSTALGPSISGNTIWRNKATLEQGSGSPPPGNGGGIYAGGVTDLMIVANRISENEADTRGDGIYCRELTDAAVKSNWLANNDGDGIYCAAPFLDELLILNNTVIEHSSASPYSFYSAICCDATESSASIINNIIAFNEYGIHVINAAAPTIDHNCLYENDMSFVPYDLTRTDCIFDSPHLRPDGIHISQNSPCIDAGINSVVQDCDEDIDGQERILEWLVPVVDIGADEIYRQEFPEGGFGLLIDADPGILEAGLPSTVTATVYDPPSGDPVEGHEVRFTVLGGIILADPPPDPPGQLSLQSDDEGRASILVTRKSPGTATVAAEIDQPPGGTTSVSTDIEFYVVPLDWPMFMHDAQHTGLLDYYPDWEQVTLVEMWNAPAPTANTSRDGTFGEHHHPGYEKGVCVFDHPYIDSSPVVYDGKVIVGCWVSGDYSNDAHTCDEIPMDSCGDIRCFDAATGDELWVTAMRPVGDGPDQPIGGIASTPCIARAPGIKTPDPMVYVGSADGYLYCIGSWNGTVAWASLTTDRDGNPSKILASPVVHNGIVYVGNEAGKMYAFDLTSGDPVDGYPVVIPQADLNHIVTSNGVYADVNMVGCSSAAVATTALGDYLIFGCDNEYLYSINLSGTPELRRDTRGPKPEGGGPGYCMESSPTVIVDEFGMASSVLIGHSDFRGTSLLRFSMDASGEDLQMNLQTALGLGEHVDEFGQSIGDFQECRATAALRSRQDPASAYVGVDTGDTFHKVALDDPSDPLVEKVNRFKAPYYMDYFVGSAAVTSGGLAFVGNDNGFLYVLDAEVEGMDAEDDDWKKMEPPRLLDPDDDLAGGHICSSPALTPTSRIRGVGWP